MSWSPLSAITYFHLITQQSTTWTAPATWGISDSQTNYKNITNLNASNWIVGNQTIDDYNKDLYTFITNNNVTKCPIDTPFFRGSDSKCVACNDPTPVFDLYKKDCISCPTGTKLNSSTHKCEKAETPAPTSKCPSNYVWNEAQKSCNCPEAFPIDLGCECVKCLEPFVWNSAERACKLRCEESHIWNKDTQKCECPKSTPYEVNGECIACNAPFEWKAEGFTCQLKVNNCPAPTAPTTPTTPTTPSVQTCGSNFIWDSNVQQCVCPADLPFNDGAKCLQCNLPQYWDHNLKQCLYCPQRQFFNTLSRACEPCPSSRPLWRNYACEACQNGTTYNQQSNTCDSGDSFIDPSSTNKVPVSTTVDSGFIDPAATAKVPVYSTSPTQ